MGSLTSLASLGLDIAMTRQAQKADSKRLEKDRERQLRDIMAKDADDRRRTESTLQRRLAQERARAGAAGVGGSGGSADAVLQGLAEESRLARGSSSDETRRRLDAVRDTFSQRRQQSLLDYSSRWLNLGSQAVGSGSRRSLLD